MSLPISHSLKRVFASRIQCSCTAQARRCLPVNSTRRQLSATSDSHLPRLAQPSFWETVFPQSLRQKARDFVRPSQKKPINPASYFIWIYLLIGSQAIRILGVKNESEVYMRRADLQIAKLREVIERLQKGEAVDVEKALGTGDEAEELEWENALREIEKEEREWQENRKRKEDEARRLEEERSRFEVQRQDASPLNKEPSIIPGIANAPKPPTAPGFY